MAFKWIGKSEDGQTVTLNKLAKVASIPGYATPEWIASNGNLIGTGAILDVETTGLDRAKDKVIEIGLRKFKFNKSDGAVLNAEENYSALQDPGEPLSPQIIGLTGLTDQMVKNQKIDWARVHDYLADAEIIIAHNAAFDRQFIDRYAPISSSKIWGCSVKQVDWPAKGFSSSKLEVLSIFHGFFVDAHRALNDVDALTYLLSLTDNQTGKAYFHELLENSGRPLVKVVASGSPFETKDILKSRGYYWDAGNRAWFKAIYKDALDAEVAWLEKAVYGGRAFPGAKREIPLVDNFKG